LGFWGFGVLGLNPNYQFNEWGKRLPIYMVSLVN